MNEVSDDMSLVTQQAVLDMGFIQRNIRDLSKTAQFSHMSELEELHKLAYGNLKEQLQPGKPLAVDPELVLETYKTLSGVVLQIVEAKRRAADTLLKARTLFDEPPSDYDNDEDGLPEDGLYEASETETGVFGKLINNDSEVEESEDDPDVAM